MLQSNSERVGYVLTTYPCFSDASIINEILAHEEAGSEIEIFSLQSPIEEPFHEAVAQVQAQVTYLPCDNLPAYTLWDELQIIATLQPRSWSMLAEALHEDVHTVYQAVMLARMVRVREITRLHAHHATASTTVARLAARVSGVPFSFTVYSDDLEHVSSTEFRRKLDDATAVFTVNNTTADRLRMTYGPSAGHVECIYNGFDLHRLLYQSPAARPLTDHSIQFTGTQPCCCQPDPCVCRTEAGGSSFQLCSHWQ